MNKKTEQAVIRHGESIIRAFPNCTEKNPVALCKKLRRIENSIAPTILRNCNEGVPDDEMEAACDKAMLRLCKLLNGADSCLNWPAFINRDPRGYALKLSSEWTDAYNRNQYAPSQDHPFGRPIYTDMGGYGILAPDLNEK